MKILYFSGSGNSKYVAEKFSERLNSECLQILKSENTVNDEEIGFIFPNYCSDIPIPVKDKLNKMNFPNAKYTFCIICAGGIPDGCFTSVRKILKIKNIALNYSGLVNMFPSWAVTLIPEMAGMENSFNKKADGKIDEHISRIKNHTNNKTVNYPDIFTKIFRESKYIMLKHFAGTDKQSVTEKCTGCGKCAADCPTDNIVIIDKKAVFSDKCIGCYKCAFECSQEAVKFGNIKIEGKRNHNPYSKS